MDHHERYQLALDLTARMAAAHPVILGGLYGSTARGTDTPWSDLELWFVVEDDCPAQGKHFVYRDISVGYQVYRERELLAILTQPDERWPFHMGVLSVLKTLHGDPAAVARWLAAGQAVPAAQFYQYLAGHLPGWVVESYGRIHSCALRENREDAFYAAVEVLFEMQTALCLLNQRWVTRDYNAGLRQVAAFPKIPAGYAEILPALLEARDVETMLPLADRLVANFWALMEAEGIRMRNYQTVEEIPI